ncbi:MAG TPA: PrgI family protein [Candidatus Saccharimonadales bacterium]
MAVYKVPQDVEADDKLIGPFSFRQFIYLVIVAGAIALAWVLSQLFIGLAILPLPIILFFGALALPLRKDQPMETYLAALVSFYLKPHRRIWDPDGTQELVEITAPRVVEKQLTKDISENEAERRFSYLANIVDSNGWAVRGVAQQPATVNSMNADIYYEAQQVEDVLDTSTREYNQINQRLDQSAAAHKQALMNQMHQQAMQPAIPQPAAMQPIVSTAIPNPYTNLPSTSGINTQPDSSVPEPHLQLNPYPTSMHQTVIQPIGATPAATPQNTPIEPVENTSEISPSPDIIKLANNSDLSIETIAHEANRIKKRESLPEDEVVISLH